MTEWYRPVLDRLEDGSPQYFGAPSVRIVPLRASDREASRLLQARVELAGGTIEIFVKMLKPRGPSAVERRQMQDRVARDFAATLRAHDQVGPLPFLSAVRPIACFPDELVLVTEKAPGQTLDALLDQRASWWPDRTTMAGVETTLARVGSWIRAFQAGPAANATFELAGMREYVDVRLRRLTALRKAGFSEAWRSGTLDYFDARSRHVEPGDLTEVPVHGDIAPGNILIDGDGRVIVLDFAMATSGGRYHDVARLYTQLDFLVSKPKFRRPVVETLQAALLRGFETGLTAAHPLFQLFVLQHRVCHLANLSGNPATGVSRAYNWYQRKGHRDWLRATAGLASV